MKKLNLGCGGDYKEGWVNVDFRSDIKKDVSWDLDKLPYPFKSSTFDEVLMKMVLEHVTKPIEVLKEIIRISKAGAKISVIVPHASSYAAITDIQHKTNFTENSFNPSLLEEYELTNLVLENKKFQYGNAWKKLIPLKKFLKIFFNGIYEDLCFDFVVKK